MAEVPGMSDWSKNSPITISALTVDLSREISEAGTPFHCFSPRFSPLPSPSRFSCLHYKFFWLSPALLLPLTNYGPNKEEHSQEIYWGLFNESQVACRQIRQGSPISFPFPPDSRCHPQHPDYHSQHPGYYSQYSDLGSSPTFTPHQGHHGREGGGGC